MGSMVDCFEWADAQIEARKAKIVKIFKARPNEKRARMVFEVTREGYFRIPGGRWVELSRLKRATDE